MHHGSFLLLETESTTSYKLSPPGRESDPTLLNLLTQEEEEKTGTERLSHTFKMADAT